MRVAYKAAICICLLVSVASGAPGKFDRSNFDALPDAKKIQVVLAAMEWREEQLGNVSYSLIETVRDGDDLVWRRRCELRRLGAQYRFHCQFLERSGGVPLSEYWVNWDTRQSMVFQKWQGKLSGVIRDSEAKNLQEVLYNNVLGVRIEYRPLTVAEWMTQDLMNRSYPHEIKTLLKDERTLISVSVTNGPDNIVFYVLDPNRDFMIVQFRLGHRIEPQRSPDTTSDIINASNETGLWVPMEMHEALTHPAKTRRTYVVQTFSRGSVKLEDLRIEYPAGTQVLDTINKTNTVVGPGGLQRRNNYYDPGTGQIFDPAGHVIGGTTRPTTAPSAK